MRKGSVKKLLVGLFASVCMACSFLSLGVMVPKASASGSDFEILGASVRTADPDGIRFVAQLDTQVLSSYGEEIKYGMMLVPEDMEDGAGMTVTYDGTTYTPSNPNAIVIEGGEFWSEDLREANGISIENSAFSCALMAGQGDGEEVVSFPAEFYNRPITAVGFIIPENASTVYTEKVTRSIAYVATVESLKAGYEENEVVERIVDGTTATLTVDEDNSIDAYGAYAPALTIGGMGATSSLSVTYTSSNADVAAIVDGKVQAVGEGRTTLTATATAGGASKVIATTEVTVDIAAYVVTATQNFTAGGTVTGTAEYAYGTTATLTATPNTDYTFLGWYEGDTKVSDNTSHTVTVTGDATYTAKFSAIIGMNSGLFQHVDLDSKTILSDRTLTIAGGVDVEYVGTVATNYTDFVLEYDITDFKSTASWLGVAFGGTEANTNYRTNPLIFAATDTINVLNCTLEGDNVGGGRVWYPVLTPGDASTLQGPWQATGAVHMKLHVQNGIAALTTSFTTEEYGDISTTATTAQMESTTGRVYIPVPAAYCTISNLSLIDLNGRDFSGSTVGDADVDMVSKTIKGLQETNQVKIDGRTHFDNTSGALVLRNSAAGFEVNTDSSKVVMNYSVSASPATEYLKVWVDGTESVLTLTSTTQAEVILAEGLEAGVSHHIKVAKMNEAIVAVRDQDGAADCNNIYVHGLSYMSDGAILQAPAASNLKIEVYGDSITCGYGIYGTNADGYVASQEDATATYAYKTAQELGADINVIAHQGWGILKTNQNSIWSENNLNLNFSISGCVEPPINAVWNGSVYDISYAAMESEEEVFSYDGIWHKTTDVADETKNPDWDFSSYTPDIVIIALGTNDFVNYRTDDTAFKTRYFWSYYTFILNLKAKYSDAKFVLCHGMMDSVGVLPNAIDDLYQTFVAMDGYTDSIIKVDLTGTDGAYTSGGGGHPNATEHATAADNLETALRDAGWVS